MGGLLKYYGHAIPFERPGQGEVLTRANEVHELAADVQHIGAVALYSDVRAASVIGVQAETTVPNPIPTYHERRAIRGLLGSGRVRYERIVSVLSGANESLAELQAGLDSYASTGATGGELEDVVHASSGMQLLRSVRGSANLEMALESSDIPQSLRGFKDLTAQAQGINPHGYPWSEWFKAASDEQLINFSQWYTERLKTLANPESRSAFVESLRAGYTNRVVRAMAEGWIPDNKSHLAVLYRKIRGTDVRFYSPFGKMPDVIVGLAREPHLGRPSVILPSVAGNHVTVHELGHIFAGVSRNSMHEYFTRRLGDRNIRDNIRYIDHLRTILNEGYNEHMTVALNNGDPTTICPTERYRKGIGQTDGGSYAYEPYREVFGVLMAGEEAVTTHADMRDMVTGMIAGNFGRFAHQMRQKWGGRYVAMEMLRVVREHDISAIRAENITRAGYDDNLLAEKIIARLQGID